MKNMILPKIFKPFYIEDLIRVGKENDGGYLVSYEDVMKTNKLISFGVGNDTSFEEDFLKLNDCPLDAYDGTDIEIPSFFDGNNRKLFRENIGYKSNCKKLLDVIGDINSNIFLKCDIEGSEYEILDDLILNSYKFCGIVIEFHDVYQSFLFNEVTNFISKIDLKLAHIHMNNYSYAESPNGYLPGCVEMTFTSSKNISLKLPDLPNKLDMPNAPDREEFGILF